MSTKRDAIDLILRAYYWYGYFRCMEVASDAYTQAVAEQLGTQRVGSEPEGFSDGGFFVGGFW